MINVLLGVAVFVALFGGMLVWGFFSARKEIRNMENDPERQQLVENIRLAKQREERLAKRKEEIDSLNQLYDAS